ncbi:hypothetical protein OF83DRAFT_1097786 [Amylostereum chailletii]|nr:hypothetical protein OF83DRAFT_1097786 [Amylostereum chailletii]
MVSYHYCSLVPLLLSILVRRTIPSPRIRIPRRYLNQSSKSLNSNQAASHALPSDGILAGPRHGYNQSKKPSPQ